MVVDGGLALGGEDGRPVRAVQGERRVGQLLRRQIRPSSTDERAQSVRPVRQGRDGVPHGARRPIVRQPHARRDGDVVLGDELRLFEPEVASVMSAAAAAGLVVVRH